MLYAQYLRIETKAGGVSCTDRQFIKAAHTLLNPNGKKLGFREARHKWLRDGIYKLNMSRGYL